MQATVSKGFSLLPFDFLLRPRRAPITSRVRRCYREGFGRILIAGRCA